MATAADTKTTPPPVSVRRWVIYALGGGFGHLTRACALARAASPARQIQILTNSPYAACVQDALPSLDLVALDPAMTVVEARAQVGRYIAASGATCLIVDTFPRGLVGELVDVLSSFAGPKVLVQRDVNPDYAAAFQLNTFVAETYDLVLVPGERTDDGLGPFSQSAATAPWLVRSQEELRLRESAREVLRLYSEKPCAIVCAAGNPDELEWYGAVATHLLAANVCDVRCIAPVCPANCPTWCWINYWPAIDLYAAADVVIGSAGYNTIHECLACGVPLVARPWPRKYDRQSLRAARAAVRQVETPEQAVKAALDELTRKPARYSQFHNGSHEAVALIERLQHGTVSLR